MKVCPFCDDPHEKPGIYCSRTCVNRSRTKTPEQRAKTSASLKASYAALAGADRTKRFEQLRDQGRQLNKLVTKNATERRETKPFEEWGWDWQRAQVIKEQEGRCAKCNIKDWQGSPIVLEIDHKDGDNDNSARENLEGLCPNCHSQSTTWRGRNIQKNKKKISDEELLTALNAKEGNIRQALISVGMAAKGANYFRAKALLKRL